MKAKTVTGKTVTATVGFRIPLDAYERAVKLAQQRGYRKLSQLLRPFIIEGLDRAERQDGDNGRRQDVQL